ncbi:hypothetical protein C6990_01855 [Nitrosopumilus sp. b3]|nr:hypothetical protein C6990_01855 [Nitrosopumilus sp. b3]
MITPVIIFSAYAENSWTVFINPYEDLEKKELFQPRELPIFSGDNITWQNNDITTHKIVSGVPNHPDYSGEYFATETISPGKDYTISLDFNGFAGYYYFCEIHPWFTGKIFFEDRPDIFYSTLDISYKILENEILSIGGLVDTDFGKTEYEILIYDSEGNLVYQKGHSFEPDASFNTSIDISEPIWKKDENYMMKLVYGVPSESTSMPLKIPKDASYEKSKYLEFCQDFKSEDNFMFEKMQLPNWYKKALCWYGDEVITEKEFSDSLNFFKNIHLE